MDFFAFSRMNLLVNVSIPRFHFIPHPNLIRGVVAQVSSSCRSNFLNSSWANVIKFLTILGAEHSIAVRTVTCSIHVDSFFCGQKTRILRFLLFFLRGFATFLPLHSLCPSLSPLLFCSQYVRRSFQIFKPIFFPANFVGNPGAADSTTKSWRTRHKRQTKASSTKVVDGWMDMSAALTSPFWALVLFSVFSPGCWLRRC